MTQLTTAQKRELQPVATQAVDEGRADAQPDPIHEQVVEDRLGEVFSSSFTP